MLGHLVGSPKSQCNDMSTKKQNIFAETPTPVNSSWHKGCFKYSATQHSISTDTNELRE
jgi:hypothetical protein